MAAPAGSSVPLYFAGGLLVVFSRQFSIYPVEGANSRQTLETIMANTLHLQQTSPWTVDRVHATVGDAVRALAADHTLALSAATIAASSPRQRLAEVRAMYVPPLDPHPDSDVVSLNTSCAT